MLDRPTGVKLSVSVLGDFLADGDAPTAAQIGAPRVQLGSFTASLSPKSVAELQAAAARVASATAAPAPRALAARAAVLVAWSDGNRYRGTVQSMSEGQVHVAFADGAAHWIPMGFVTLA